MLSSLRRAFRGTQTSAAIAGELKSNGVTKINGLVPQILLQEIIDASNEIYAHRDTANKLGTLPASLYDQHVRKRLILLREIRLTEGDALNALALPILVETAFNILGHEPELSSNSFVRTIHADRNAWQLPFHQDQSLLNRPLLNIWIALTPCGLDAPGLEVVRTPKTEILSTFADDRKEFSAAQRQISESDIIARYGASALWHPTMQPGDALVFLGTTIHRTYTTARMTKPRTSIELRLV